MDSFIGESSFASWSKCDASHLPNHFSISCIKLEHTILLLCVFYIFLFTSNVILGSRCEGLVWTLHMHSTPFSMTMILMGSYPISRIRRVYDVLFLTWRHFVRKCFWTFSNSFQWDLWCFCLSSILPPHREALMLPKC